ncbi:MAG: recombination protein RecT [Firmicutes bacterium]|nr:recombination protein RecT [Bacillota bacterium]MBE3590855.1 recombination protein RecT [Bacillota bacterium]
MSDQNNARVKDALVQRPANGSSSPARQTPEKTVRQLIERMMPEIKRALPRHMSADRLARIALTTIRQTPKLLECDQSSLLGAVMQAAQLGLEPGLLGHCYIIPYGREATFIVGYRGMIDLARRSGNIQSIYAQVVYQNDHFVLRYGLDEKLEHIPWHLREDQAFENGGPIRGAYMVAKFKDGGHFVHYMPIQEIEAHRKRSKAANNGPWVTDYEEMCKKTVVRAGWKWLPISVEIMRAVEATDEQSKTAEQVAEGDDAIDVPFQVAGETPSAEPEPAPAAPAQEGLQI